ncbi:MAG: DUF4422 domain-containing protein [Lachnospiraceae bacterium]|nr:DUF4422 domain-containing protein [Lachnospiraceae bacterium]
MTHKKFEPPKGETYEALQVGAGIRPDLGYSRDDGEDNISSLNPYYAELTGMYHVWKNVKDKDIVGICHYRRYPLDAFNRAMSGSEYEMILKNYDLICSKLITLPNTYYYGFSQNHRIEDLEECRRVIKELYPLDYPVFEEVIHSNRTYFGNIIVAKKELYDSYCSWLFPIFFRVHEKRAPYIEKYNDYNKRVYGFISEILQYVYVKSKGLKAYEALVGMLSEKKESAELKERLSVYFKEKDWEAAKAYLEAMLRKRPDLIMEASDLDGELKLAMELLIICEYDKKSILELTGDWEELMNYVRALNRSVLGSCKVTGSESLVRLMTGDGSGDELFIKNPPGDKAKEIAIRILGGER